MKEKLSQNIFILLSHSDGSITEVCVHTSSANLYIDILHYKWCKPSEWEYIKWDWRLMCTIILKQ